MLMFSADFILRDGMPVFSEMKASCSESSLSIFQKRDLCARYRRAGTAAS
jgi:hypothetical protein